MSGLLAGVILVMGVVVTRKWLVPTESSIAHSLIDFMLISTVDKLALAAYLKRLQLVFSVVVLLGAARVLLRIHACGFAHPAGGFGVPTSLGVPSCLGILWQCWGIM